MTWRGGKQDRELEEELAAHLRLAAGDRARAGETAAAAEQGARREIGNIGLIKETTRDMWSWTALERCWQDLRYGLRLLRRSPGFAAVAICSLALGIGANAAIFSLINAVMLSTLPVQNPQQLVAIGDGTRISSRSNGSGFRTDLLSYPFYQRFRERNRTFSDVYATGRCEHLTISESTAGGNVPQGGKTRGRFVSGNFFSVLGVPALLGRTFSDKETQVPGATPVAVISFEYWQRQFGGDPAIVGRRIAVNGSPFTIIGVTPRAFSGDLVGLPVEIWFPLTMQAQANPGYDYLRQSHTSWLLLMGRLKPGVTLAQSAAATDVLARQIFRELYLANTPADEFRTDIRAKLQVSSGAKGFSRMRHDFSAPLLVLMGVVALVLLICCANVANLQMARAASRQREMTLRLAVGAGRGRLLRQLLTESLLLAAAGGALALLFSSWTSRLLLRLVSQGDQLPLEPRVDARMLLFTAAVALASGILFGLLPALQSTRSDLVSGLRETRAGQSFGSSPLFGRALIVLQVMLSMILLAGAGLCLKTLQNLETLDVGYVRHGLLLAEVDFVMAGYNNNTAIEQLARRLMEAMRQVPGVEAATISENGLFSGTDSTSDGDVEGYTPASYADTNKRSDRVGPDYFRIVGTPVIAGRGIAAQDVENAPKVAVINETMARFYFPHENPIGRHIFDGPNRKLPSYAIVGVVRDARQADLREAVPKRYYTAFFQPVEPIDVLNLEVRTAGRSANFLDPVRRRITAVDPKLSLTSLATADQLVDDTLGQEKLVAKLSTLFGGLALFLAAIGLYGVMSYRTARRTSEIGIRMALGAARGQVLGMVLKEAFELVAIGLLIGVVCSLGLAALLHRMFFGLSAFEALPLLGAMLAITFLAAAASLIPAWRAAQVDPTRALRYE